MDKKEIFVAAFRQAGYDELADQINIKGLPVEMVAPMRLKSLKGLLQQFCSIRFTKLVGDQILLSWKKLHYDDIPFYNLYNHYDLPHEVVNNSIVLDHYNRIKAHR